MDALMQWVSLAVEQFNWRQPGWLNLLPLVALAAAWWRHRGGPSHSMARRLSLYADIRFWPLVVRGADARALANRPPSPGTGIAPWIATGLIVIALAGPRWLHEKQTVFREGADIAVVMDISRSMDTRDIPPDRLTRAKEELQDLLARLHGDRVALVAFAGRAFTIVPLTADYGAVERFAEQLSPDMVTDQGSNLAAGLRQGLAALSSARGRGRAVVLLSDGEDHDHAAALAAAARLGRDGVPLFILGVGTTEGGLIPAGDGRFVHDSHGRTVLSRLEEEHLKDLAQAAGGVYARIRWDDADWQALYDHGIERMVTRTRTASRSRARWREEYGWALFPAMLMFGWWWRGRFRQWLA
jgi:Ca-activated chloride channel family protein